MISVIIPVFNVKPYLVDAIESVLSQTYIDIEVVLVDDGSTDGSGDICDKYGKKDNRIQVIHQTNEGLSAARNAGLDICRGDHIAFLDSDDVYCQDILARMVHDMSGSGADIVECNYTEFKGLRSPDTGKFRKKKSIAPGKNQTGLYTKREALRMHVEGKIANNVWSKLYKRELWDDLRFPKGQDYEDLDIVLPLLAKAEKIYILDEILIMHRIRSGSITQTYSLQNIKDRELAHRHYREYIMSHIPDYFEQKDWDMAVIKSYRSFFITYCIYSGQRVPEKKQCLEFLRNVISGLEKHIDIRECSMKVRLASFLYSYFPPFLIGSIYRVYRPFRLLMLRVCS